MKAAPKSKKQPPSDKQVANKALKEAKKERQSKRQEAGEGVEPVHDWSKSLPSSRDLTIRDAEEFIKGVTKTYSVEKDGKVIRRFSNGELKDFFAKNNVSISSNGVLYDLTQKGVIPAILEKWFNERPNWRLCGL